jgi:Peptidase A4 family
VGGREVDAGIETFEESWLLTRKGSARKWLLLAVAVLLCGLGLIVPSVSPPSAGAATPATFFPSTGFGGYRWWGGDVSQISAQWRVPTISENSAAGSASTWIGAQNSNGGPPFIQLGTIENLDASMGPNFEAFWSDTAVGFHPKPLIPVEPGDLVSAQMVDGAKGWTLTIRDFTRSMSQKITIGYGVGKQFTQGEWLQEDPTMGDVVTRDLPYPTISDTQFSSLLLNHAPPKLTLKNAQVLMADGGAIRVPSSVIADGFTYAAPQGAAREYLEGARTLDMSIATFQVGLLRWQKERHTQKEAIATGVAKAYGVFATNLSADAFPMAARASTKLLATRNRQIQKDFQAWQASGYSLGTGAFENLYRDMQLRPIATNVRSALGLPPT